MLRPRSFHRFVAEVDSFLYKYLFSVYCVPDTILSAGDTDKSPKIDKNSILMTLTVQGIDKAFFFSVPPRDTHSGVVVGLFRGWGLLSLFDFLNTRSRVGRKALAQPEIIFNYITRLHKYGSGLFSKAQAAQMSQLRTLSLLLKADSSKMVHTGLLLSGYK